MNEAHAGETPEDRGEAPAQLDERHQTANARRARHLALIDGIMRDYEPVLRELGHR